MEKRNVMLKNLCDCQIAINLPELHYNRTFEKKGAMKPIPYDVLQEAIWDRGFAYMLKNGMIEIIDEAICNELKIAKVKDEKEYIKARNDYNNETVVLILDDNQKKRYLTVAPIHELKEVLSKLTNEQQNEFVNFAVQNKLINYEKVELIKKVTGRDILKEVEFNRAMEE